MGGRLLWETAVDGLRLGGRLQALRLDVNAPIPTATGSMTIEDDFPFMLWLTSAEYTVHDLLLAGELGYWHADNQLNGQVISGTTNQRFYGMASYRAGAWFWPGVYYSS